MHLSQHKFLRALERHHVQFGYESAILSSCVRAAVLDPVVADFGAAAAAVLDPVVADFGAAAAAVLDPVVADFGAAAAAVSDPVVADFGAAAAAVSDPVVADFGAAAGEIPNLDRSDLETIAGVAGSLLQCRRIEAMPRSKSQLTLQPGSRKSLNSVFAAIRAMPADRRCKPLDQT